MITTTILILAGIYLLMSLITYVAFVRDKRIAERNARRLKAVPRVPERTLHTLELLGGWIGSLIAQRTLRHKVRQRPYQVVFWAIVALHVAVWLIFGGVTYFR